MTIKRRIKFIWGASKVVRGKWYLGLVGLYERIEGVRDSGLAISVRGLLAWGGVLALLAWVALATAGFWFWQRNPYSVLTYSDALLYPLRRAEIAEKKGQAYIAQGLELVRSEKWFDGVSLLRLGLARYPRDNRARLVLAQFHQLTNQSALALQILTDGLGDEYPGRPYVEAILRLAAAGEDFDAAAAVAAQLLPVAKRQGLALEQRWLVEKRYAALTSAGRHAEALALVESEGSGDMKEERRVLSLLAAGQPAAALAALAEWRAQPGADVKVVCRLEVRAHREAKRLDDMERGLQELRQRSPGDAGALAFGVVQRVMAGLDAPAAAALDDYIFRFGGFGQNLDLVAGALAELGQVSMLRRCIAAARERGFALQALQTQLINAHVGRGEWAEAAQVLAALGPVPPKDPLGKPWRDWMHLLLAAARGGNATAEGELLEMVRSRPWSLEVYRRSADVLQRAEKLESAREIAELGLRGYPVSKSLQTLRAEIQRRLTAQAAAAPVAAADTGREPETVFQQRVDFLVRTKNWSEAAAFIGQVERQEPRPEWLAARAPALRLVQVRIAQGRRDRSELAVSARAFLNGAVTRSTELLEVAQEFHAAGDRQAALALAREISRSTPGFAAAQRALREWEPATGGAAVAAGETAPVARTVGTGSDQAPAPAVLVAQLRERYAAGDTPGLRTAARLLLTGERAAADQALLLVREWAMAGDRAAAELLLKEVFQKHEAYPPARRLQQELNLAGSEKR